MTQHGSNIKRPSLALSTYFEPSTINIVSGVEAVGDIKIKQRNERKINYRNEEKCNILHPCSDCPDATISTHFCTDVDFTHITMSASLCYYRLKECTLQLYEVYFFSPDFNGWPQPGKHQRDFVIYNIHNIMINIKHT